MKKIVIVLLFSIFYGVTIAQFYSLDSLKNKLNSPKTDTGRIKLLQDIAFNYLSYNNDSAFFYAQQALKLLSNVEYPRGKVLIYRTLGMSYERYGNYPMALKSYLTLLETAEKNNDVILEGVACIRLAAFFATQQNYNSSEFYLNRAKRIITRGEFQSSNYNNKCYTLFSIGESYLDLNRPDSALKYRQQAYEIALAKKIDNRLPGILGRLGDIHQSLGNYGLALEYYRTYQREEIKQRNYRSDFNDGIATLFLKQGNIDSALYYTRIFLQRSNENKTISPKTKGYKLLSQIFDKTGKIDSAYYYNKLATTLKDSIYSKEKEQQIQNLNYSEQQRQLDIETKKVSDANKRKSYIQFALLALGIITFIILFLLLSRSFITNEKVIRFFGVVALLIVFEFLNLVLHPFLENITHHSPVLMLLALVCIAALLVPAHHQLEKWMTHTMVEKNKKIRLAAAKKTIEKLEGKTK